MITAADAEYEAARGGFDLSQLHEPTLIVEAGNVGDVAASLGFAERHHLPVAVQATGHGTSGALRGGLLISTRRLTSVSVDPSRRTARVQAGATWTNVLAATTPYGLAPLCGSAPAVGAVGYLLGGGLGPLGRLYGFGADHVASFTAATVGGEVITISADSEPDLFWGMRGAGTNFTVATEVEIGLQPVSHVFGGGLYFPGEAAASVLAAFVETI
ncbi:MAG: FAD-binding oxidoreductase, partial [Janthinobacterium lividum]